MSPGSGELGMMRDTVVVGDGQEIQASFCGQAGKRGRREDPVRVDRVAMEIAGQPLSSRGRRQIAPRRPFRASRWRW